jgi:hypothetical protein
MHGPHPVELPQQQQEDVPELIPAQLLMQMVVQLQEHSTLPSQPQLPEQHLLYR